MAFDGPVHCWALQFCKIEAFNPPLRRMKLGALIMLLLPAEVHLDAQDGELRQYVLKREFAEGAIYMTMLQFPEGGLLAAQSGPHNLYRYLTFKNMRHVGLPSDAIDNHAWYWLILQEN